MALHLVLTGDSVAAHNRQKETHGQTPSSIRLFPTAVTMESGPPMLDALSKLEMAIRPQSVPSWLSSDTNHAPKITALGPRRSTVEYIDIPSTSGGVGSAVSGKGAGGAAAAHTTAAAGSLVGGHRHAEPANSGPSLSSVRPRAPILIQKDAAHEGDFLAKESEHDAPKRSRQRIRHQTNGTKSRFVASMSLMGLTGDITIDDVLTRTMLLS